MSQHKRMHTTGQGFMMAFQAAGPHAQDRGLEAVAYAYAEMTRTPASARWEKPAGRGDPIRLDKTYTIVPRCIGLVIGVSTFPTWNGYPAIFADLATGNPVIVKPHPAAILPLAHTVRIARETLKEAGFDPNLVLLANAVHATTGQAFVMAFQAGGPHALDRALEAVAYAYVEMTRTDGDGVGMAAQACHPCMFSALARSSVTRAGRAGSIPAAAFS